jgi:hypothetical protein
MIVEGVLFSIVIPMEAFLLGINLIKKIAKFCLATPLKQLLTRISWPDDYENTPFWFKNLSIGIIFYPS